MKQWTLVLGRFQCLPPHEGHIKLIRKVLDEGRNVCIGLREGDGSESDPYDWGKRCAAFAEIFKQEIAEDRVSIINLPDINDVVYGRKVGWTIREIRLDEETEAISGTEMRKKGQDDSVADR